MHSFKDAKLSKLQRAWVPDRVGRLLFAYPFASIPRYQPVT